MLRDHNQNLLDATTALQLRLQAEQHARGQAQALVRCRRGLGDLLSHYWFTLSAPTVDGFEHMFAALFTAVPYL